MKKLLLILLLLSNTAYANSNSLNLQLPNGQNNYSSDKFKAGDLDCQNAIGSATQLEVGVTGIIDKGYYDSVNDYVNTGSNVGDVGMYARITIPLGKRVRQRINCNELYELELQKKRLEVMRLERELEQLRNLQFEN